MRLPEKDSALIRQIGRRIQSRRKALGLTQEQLAERANLTQQYITYVEGGRRGLREETIIKLSQALQVSSDYILFGSNCDPNRNRMLELMKPLTDKQLMWLEEMINIYLKACGYDDSSDTP